MDTVYVHKYAGILSAYGMALADVIHEEQSPCVLEYSKVAEVPIYLKSFTRSWYYIVRGPPK
jgi:N-methylhydantoinase A/oxoprolinase/acetone carboxylase beta subunit